jgi:hypothetical protein
MKSALIALALPFAIYSQSHAQELSQQSLFHRCYAQLTGNAVPLNHALMNQVVAGKVTAAVACKQILSKALLNAQGSLASTTDAEAKAVLNNFYNFHRTWFPANNFDSVSGYSSTEHNGSLDVYDATESALALTYSMFGLNQKYSDTLNRSTGVRALRVEDSAVVTRIGWKGGHASRMLSNTAQMATSKFQFRSTELKTTAVGRNINRHINIKADVPVIQVGDLVGIVPNTQSFIVPNISMAPSGNNTTDKGILVADFNYTYDLFKNHGGGVIGSPIYLMQYFGHGFNVKFNGQSKVARRWSQQNMESFLCASLPALRESDVQSFVDSSSSAAFRNSSSCVMCHATLDPMAYTARNFTRGAFDIFRTTQDGDVTLDANGNSISPPAAYSRNALAITTYKTTASSVGGWPSEPVTDFHKQTPTGRLFYRSATGVLVDKNVSGIAGLGKAMSETDDYYLCAAKRYFEFMTGIKVPIYDRTDPRNSSLNQALSAAAIADRNYVESLAKDLRTSNSVIKMVEEIMSSDYYSKENFR